MRRFLLVTFAFSVFLISRMGMAGGGPATLISGLKVHNPIHQGNLTIFPISSGSSADTSAFLTLDEGLKQGLVKVGELGALRGAGVMVRPIEPGPVGRGRPIQMNPQISAEAARVNELAIQNLSDKPLLLLAGEVVSGGKQDRVVGRDRIVTPHSEPIPLTVFCVEPGRWQGQTAQFAASKAMAHPQLRKEVTEAKDQRKVWDEVAKANSAVAESVAAAPAAAGTGAAGGARAGVISGRLVVTSPSSFAQTMEHRPVQDKLSENSRVFLQGLPRGTIGVVVALNGRPVWADLFASPSLFERYRDKLLQSYVVEAMRSGEARAAAPAAPDARDFLRWLEGRQSIEVEPNVYRLVRTDAAGLVTYELESLGPRALPLHLARMAQ